MKEKIKKNIIFTLIGLTILIGAIDVAYGVYFGVLTNVLINAFWNSKLFPEKKKTDRQLIVENVSRPKF